MDYSLEHTYDTARRGEKFWVSLRPYGGGVRGVAWVCKLIYREAVRWFFPLFSNKHLIDKTTCQNSSRPFLIVIDRLRIQSQL